MSEPIRVNPDVHQVIISLTEVEEATGLRELADYLDALDGEYLLHSVTYHAGGSRLFEETATLTALVEDLRSAETKERYP